MMIKVNECKQNKSSLLVISDPYFQPCFSCKLYLCLRCIIYSLYEVDHKNHDIKTCMKKKHLWDSH